jgi:hypothetical protein
MEEPTIYYVPDRNFWVCVCRVARGEGRTKAEARTAWAEWYDRTVNALRGHGHADDAPRRPRGRPPGNPARTEKGLYARKRGLLTP